MKKEHYSEFDKFQKAIFGETQNIIKKASFRLEEIDIMLFIVIISFSTLIIISL